MTNDEMLRNIEYLREKANVSYEEAAELLERYDGNVMRVLVELEREGRVYAQPAEEPRESRQSEQVQQEYKEAKQKATSFINKAFQTRVVVERNGSENGKDRVLNLSAPVAVGIAIAAPWVTLASAGLAFVTGHTVKIEKKKEDKKEEEAS